MPLRLLAVTFDAHEPAVVARFWAALLSREVVQGRGGIILTGSDTQVGLRFAHAASPRVAPNRMHLHLTSSTLDDQSRTVETALRLGAQHLDVGQRPEEGHVVLADPEGNEFCVIGPGNSFLSGCGHLGEVACDGTRAVGLFWSEALGWPLVWDQDEETAIQSPLGGTKVAWGGPPVAPRVGPDRQRLDLAVAAGEPDAEVDRLVRLGARRVRDTRPGTDGHDVLVKEDQDGNEFHVHSGHDLPLPS
jgi:hypothetical protein